MFRILPAQLALNPLHADKVFDFLFFLNYVPLLQSFPNVPFSHQTPLLLIPPSFSEN